MVIKKEGSWNLHHMIDDFVVGNDPNCPTPWASFRLTSTGLENGIYVDTEDEAVKDLIERAGYGS